MDAADDDLLAPTLTPLDDAVGFDRPWNPQWLVFVAAIGGLMAAGWLLGENFRRLGRPERRWLTVALTTAVALATVSFGVWVHLHGWPGAYVAGNQEHKRMFRLANQALAIAVALGVAAVQQPRWRIFARHGGEHAPLFRDAVVAIAAAVAVQALAAAGVVAIFGLPGRPT